MKISFFVLILCFGFAQPADARFYTGFAMSRLSADFRNFDITETTQADVTGGMELLGIQFGYENMSAGNVGIDLGLAFIGVNSQQLNPTPDWGNPWFYKLTTKANYLSSWGLYGFLGVDLIGNISRVDSSYFGPGFVFGAGYKVRENVTVAVSGTNNSVLFAPESNKRFLRGYVVEANFHF
jgi:hypothetical protein